MNSQLELSKYSKNKEARKITDKIAEKLNSTPEKEESGEQVEAC